LPCGLLIVNFFLVMPELSGPRSGRISSDPLVASGSKGYSIGPVWANIMCLSAVGPAA